MYRKIVIIALVLSLFTVAKAQTIDSKLLSVYTQEQLSKMEANAPGSVEYLNYYANHAYRIIDAPQKEIGEVQELFLVNHQTGEQVTNLITEHDLSNFNPLLYNCKTANKTTFYSIIGSSKLIMMYSSSVLQDNFRRQSKK